MTEDDPRAELAALVAGLRVHAETCALTGAFGLPAASDALIAQRKPSAGNETAHHASDPPPGTSQRRVEPPRGEEPRTSSAPRATAAAPAREPVSPADARRRLDVLATEVASCTRCRLHETRTQTVFARGTGSSGICFVGEGPGADEDEQGLPFVGKAGQLLDRMIVAMGFSRDEVYVCNVVKCRPPKNRKPEPDETAACKPYITEQLTLLEPKVIVALGATAVEGLLGISGGITRLRGNWRLYQGRIAVMPTFHPAYLLRTPEAKRDVWNDLQEVLKHLGRSVPSRA